VVEVQGQFGNPEGGKHQLSEAVTVGFIKSYTLRRNSAYDSEL
jgi:hypothetical protein